MKWDRSNASKEDVIKDLKRLTKELGKSPTGSDCNTLSDIPFSILKKHFGTLNKALTAARLPVNRLRAKVVAFSKRPSTRRYKFHEPVFMARICNVCSRDFMAEDDMRSCHVCTHTKNADKAGGLSDTRYGIGYLT